MSGSLNGPEASPPRTGTPPALPSADAALRLVIDNRRIAGLRAPQQRTRRLRAGGLAGGDELRSGFRGVLLAGRSDAAAPRALLPPDDEGARAVPQPRRQRERRAARRAHQLRESARDLRSERGERRSDAAEQRAGGAEQCSRRCARGAHATDRQQHRVRQQGAPGADEQAPAPASERPNAPAGTPASVPGEADWSRGGRVAKASSSSAELPQKRDVAAGTPRPSTSRVPTTAAAPTHTSAPRPKPRKSSAAAVAPMMPARFPTVLEDRTAGT